MKAKWRQPTTLGLAERLKEVNEKLREVLPQIIEAQAKALEGIAQTAISRLATGDRRLAERNKEQEYKKIMSEANTEQIASRRTPAAGRKVSGASNE